MSIRFHRNFESVFPYPQLLFFLVAIIKWMFVDNCKDKQSISLEKLANQKTGRRINRRPV